MNEVFEWVSSLDLSVIYTAIIGFATTWGGSIIALTVALIKQRAANINLQVAIEKKGIQLNEELTITIDNVFEEVPKIEKTEEEITETIINKVPEIEITKNEITETVVKKLPVTGM